MKVGVTGHQERKGIRWSWVEHIFYNELSRIPNVEKALTSLAAGTDQIFAEVALNLHIPVLAVLPIEGYERFFKGSSLVKYRRLLKRCQSLQLTWTGSPEKAFFETGKFIVNACDLLFTVWDGDAAASLGGTADVVSYARRSNRPIIHINPHKKTVCRI